MIRYEIHPSGNHHNHMRRVTGPECHPDHGLHGLRASAKHEWVPLIGVTSTGTIQNNGTNRFIIVNPAGGRFYRFAKP